MALRLMLAPTWLGDADHVKLYLVSPATVRNRLSSILCDDYGVRDSDINANDLKVHPIYMGQIG